MSNTKKVNQDERQQQLSEREELEQMLQSSSDNLESLTEEAKKLSLKHKPITLDYQGIMTSSNSEAMDIVGANAMFYLNEEIIDTEEYIQQKMRSDVATMSDLIRQSKVAEYSIIKMLEQIEEGNMQSRQFEVLSGFQRSKLELTKAIANYVVVMENNYKAIKEDYRVKREENTKDIPHSEVEGEGGGDADMTTRGTRGLMEKIREELDRKDRELNSKKLNDAKENQKQMEQNNTKDSPF
ncbi:MAG: hypothetical protein WC979_00950 [Candidatus Pacearchaeota archaeon]|jgi:hypothetical protein|nr:hypothetical protein [Clostridia bacterium]